ncbi:TRZ/ATZ family hydrolase [Marinospirillum alkaliphilum]|nr:TRZ/ATZ family hydrolase [Marinospirillum alkaliphilum]
MTAHSSEHPTSLLCPQWLLTMDEQHPDQGLQPLTDQAVVLAGDRILDVLPLDQARLRYPQLHPLPLPEQVLLPGLHNLHGHAAMSLFRGMSDDLPLMEWLQDHIWPAEGRWVNPEFVRCGTQLAIAEMLLNGTTCFSDMYFFPEVIAEVAATSGIRAQVCTPIIQFPNAWSANPDEALDKTLTLHQQYQAHPLVRVAFGPHAPYTVDDTTLNRLADLNASLELRVQMHLHETAHEVSEAAGPEDNGITPIQRMDQLGLLNEHFQAVHVTCISPEDMQLLAERGVTVVHCPQSNLKLASGFCPVQALQNAGVRVVLGTDGAASNNDLDLWSEMQTAALLAKAVHQDAAALPATAALKMVTCDAGKAYSAKPFTGQIRSGFAADLCSLKLDQPDCWPLHHLTSQLVYGRMGDKVQQVWVNGQQRVKDGKLVDIDLLALKDQVRGWRDAIQAHHP